MPYSRPSAFDRVKVLITSGPTSVPIDAMRIITNRSTGEMGRRLAFACREQGAEVTLLEGAVTTTLPTEGIRIRKYFEFNELAEALPQELRHKYAVVFHAAAVSDFELSQPFEGKISSGSPLTLRLKPTRKLINEIKHHSPNSILVGFKLEKTFEEIMRQAGRLFQDSRADLMVANRQDGVSYEAFVLRHDLSSSRRVKSKSGLVKVLLCEVDRLLKEKRDL